MNSSAADRLNAALEGRYRVEREIGEGGMATVYLAEDLRHNRKVAVKVLKPELAAVVGAERFLAEIETTANLTHPNILPLFDSGEASAPDGRTSFVYFVMPYLEDETLRERLDRENQLPVEEAVRIASEVAEALDHAHRQGVVHRDIKPANILLREGRPLIADFGIALAATTAGGERLTETGLSLGTPYYMSPEQATGSQEVGPATDVYALGCVLYEMLVGEPPYTGSTPQAVLGKIITGGAKSVSEERRTVPPHVDGAIAKAIEKLPADRFRSAEGFAQALGDPDFRYGEEGAPGIVAGTASWNPLSIAGWSVALILAVVAGWLLLRTDPPPPVSRQLLSTDPMAGLEVPFGRYAALAPDGSSMILPVEAAGGGVGLGLKTRGSTEITPIPDTEGARDVVYSPDGQWIAYAVGSEIFKRPVVGGSPVRLADDTQSGDGPIAGIAWLDDGTVLYEQFDLGAPSGRNRRIVRIPEDGGDGTVVFWPEDTPVSPLWVHGLPDARGALVVACPVSGPCPAEETELHVVDLRSGSSERVLGRVLRAWYTPSGHIVYVRDDGAVLAAPFEVDALELTDSPRPLFEGVRISGTSNAPDMRVAPDGTLLYVEGGTSSGRNRQLVWVDRSGGEEPVDPDMPPRGFTTLALAPNDDRLALSIVGDQADDLWVKELPDGPLTRLTADPGSEIRPVWSPDGATIAYISLGVGTPHARTVRADGSSAGTSEVLLQREGALLQVLFAPYARHLIFRGADAALDQTDVGSVDLESGEVNQAVLATEFGETALALSPDGRWLAYVSDVTGRDEVFVRPFPSVETLRVQVSTNGGSSPVWAHNGRELFYREPSSGSMVAVTYGTDPAFQVEERERIFDAGPYLRGNDWRAYDVTQDDRRFVMIRPAETAGGEGGSRLVLVQNWFTELEELVGSSR